MDSQAFNYSGNPDKSFFAARHRLSHQQDEAQRVGFLRAARAADDINGAELIINDADDARTPARNAVLNGGPEYVARMAEASPYLA